MCFMARQTTDENCVKFFLPGFSFDCKEVITQLGSAGIAILV